MCEVSIVVPSYNRANQIKSCIRNLLNQSFMDFEIIVVDDGSTDNTEFVVNNISDQRVVYIKCIENKGACYARNIGIRNARGNYIAFQDSDDLWDEDKLQRQIDYLKETNADMVICKLKRLRQRRNRIFPNIRNVEFGLNQILYKNYGSTQTFLLRKECCMNDLVKFDESLPRYQDWDFLINIVQHGYKVVFLDRILAYQIVGNDTISHSNSNGIIALNRILKKYEEYYSKSPELTAYIHYLLGTHMFAQGQYTEEFGKAYSLGYRNYKCIVKKLLCEWKND